jgi:hypothetical protein
VRHGHSRARGFFGKPGNLDAARQVLAEKQNSRYASASRPSVLAAAVAKEAIRFEEAVFSSLFPLQAFDNKHSAQTKVCENLETIGRAKGIIDSFQRG